MKEADFKLGKAKVLNICSNWKAYFRVYICSKKDGTHSTVLYVKYIPYQIVFKILI